MPNTPPSTPKRKARSPSPPRGSVTPKTAAVESAFRRMAVMVTSPNRRKKFVRQQLEFVNNSIKTSVDAVRKAINNAIQEERRAILEKGKKQIKLPVLTPFEIQKNINKKMSQPKNKNTSKK